MSPIWAGGPFSPSGPCKLLPYDVLMIQPSPRAAAPSAPSPSPGGPSFVHRLAQRAKEYAHRFSLAGLIVALLFFCLSLTPSLSPRVWFYQAAATGLSLVSGYAVGVFISWAIRKLGFRPHISPRANLLVWQILAIAAGVLVPTFIMLGARWQDQIRDIFGAKPGDDWHGITQAVIALLLALTILQIARGLRWVTRRASSFFGRFVPVPLARLLAVAAVSVLTVLVINGTLEGFVLSTLNNIYADVDTTTDPGIEQPKLAERSGSPKSLSTWDTLGAQGRKFVATAPTLDELQGFVAVRKTGKPQKAVEPIRVYAGMASGDSMHDTALLVVDELDRTDAWSREVLVVATSTGTGWIDPAMAQTIEFMHGGNTAIASMQYSHLPSSVAFLTDRDTPPEAGAALFEAVYSAWSKKPDDERPRLVVFGASLGSYGSQGAFSGLQDISERTDGALWVGTPNFTPLWSHLTSERDPGSFEYAPVFDGGAHVRWAARPDASDLNALPAPWVTPNVVFLQHASDGVVWWSPALILQKPDWLAEPRGPGAHESMVWIPGVTFWQVTMDLFVAAQAPSGHAHNYHLEYSEAWASLVPPKDWSDVDTDRLRQTIARQPNET